MRLLVGALLGAPPPFLFKGGGFLGMLSWLGFSWRGKARMRRGIATTERLVVAALDPLLVTTGSSPVVTK
jgi:hypothetical protein